MWLKRLELNNVCQHRTIDWELQRGLIGVTGRNGSGKSNAVNMAYACLTNDFSRNKGTKADNIRTTMKGADETSWLRSTWAHNDHVFTIERGLTTDYHVMKRPGKKDLDRAGEIKRAVEDILEVPLDIIAEHVFIPQWAMFDWLVATPSQRAMSYARICDTERAEKVHDLIGKEVSSLTATLPAVMPDVSKLSTELRVAVKNAKAAKAELDKLRAKRLDKETLAKYRKIEKDHDESASDAVLIRQLEQQLPKRQEALEAADRALTVSSKAAIRAAKEHKAAKLWEAYDAYEKKRAALQATLDNLEEPEEPAEFEHYEDYQKQAAKIEMEIEGHQALVDTFDEEGTVACPTCGTAAEALCDSLEHARHKLDTLPKALTQLRGQLDLCREYVMAIDRYNATYHKIKGQLDGLVEVAKPAVDKPEKTAAELAKAVQKTTAEHEEFEAAIVKHRSSIERIEEQIKGYKSKPGCSVTGEEYEEAIEMLRQHDEAREDMVEAEVKYRTATAEVKNLETQLQEAQTVRARFESVSKAVEHLSQIRALVHRDSLPKLVHDGTHEALAVEINQNLAEFERPFRVIPDSKLGFRAHFRDGNEQPVERLSGGQLVVTAMTGRLGFNSLFAADLGMMVADEPTAGLDQQNLEHLRELLEKLSQHVKDRGHQVIVITHEGALMSSFDQILRVT